MNCGYDNRIEAGVGFEPLTSDMGGMIRPTAINSCVKYFINHANSLFPFFTFKSARKCAFCFDSHLSSANLF